MSFRAQMKEKKKELLTVRHPLRGEDASVRLPYVTGVALLMARADDELAAAEREALAELVYAMELPEGSLDRVLATVNDADPSIFDQILPALSAADLRLCFALDLHRAAGADGVVKDEEQEMVADFLEMLRLNEAERTFVAAFAGAMAAQDAGAANRAVQAGVEQGVEPNIGHLSYFLPSFTYQEEIPGFTLGPGESRTLNRPGRVTGKITVGTGAKLTVKGVELVFAGEAQLLVEGGAVELKGVTLKAGLDAAGPLVKVTAATPVFEASACTFDGGGKVRLLTTSAGKTTLSGCSFRSAFAAGQAQAAPENWQSAKAATFGAAIYAAGSLVLERCSFDGCVAQTAAGAVCAAGPLQAADCTFKNCQSQGVAGALAVGDVHSLTSTTFERCTAVGSGGAALVRGGKKENSKIHNCTFTECSSGARGGGFYIHEVTYNIQDCTLDRCSALEAGGGAGADYGAPHGHLQRCAFRGCSARRGGGVFVRGHLNWQPDRYGTTYEGCLPDDYWQEW